MEIPLFAENGWYLAGGTALTLQVGHRKSVDLDFFTNQKFDEGKIAEQLSTLGQWETTSMSPGTIYGEFLGAKMSLIYYPFFKNADDMLKIGFVNVITPKDISVMKVVAISQRGRKRDFIDMYWLSQNILPIEESIRRVDQQYTVKQNVSHILKSLVYFEDAENDPDPETNFKASWKEVKAFFTNQIPRVTRDLVNLN
ncbi:MAG: nucleotidyl transferase AbiEii/AbiGii toxin family protein [Candidatus Paceibacterota bacterium]